MKIRDRSTDFAMSHFRFVEYGIFNLRHRSLYQAVVIRKITNSRRASLSDHGLGWNEFCSRGLMLSFNFGWPVPISYVDLVLSSAIHRQQPLKMAVVKEYFYTYTVYGLFPQALNAPASRAARVGVYGSDDHIKVIIYGIKLRHIQPYLLE
ncbi:hypothetical protein GQ44DRAFT_301166 [Phaeosphaeriaceae sp. PMI808]|nr:hypothetical protein GQ44DRAFT_301166 [Phaeosphaeriaceae sp. PMI808]